MSDESPDTSGRGKIAALVVIVLLLACGFWLVHRLGSVGALQDCIASGRRDCG
jgi:hypothetical protein